MGAPTAAAAAAAAVAAAEKEKEKAGSAAAGAGGKKQRGDGTRWKLDELTSVLERCSRLEPNVRVDFIAQDLRHIAGGDVISPNHVRNLMMYQMQSGQPGAISEADLDLVLGQLSTVEGETFYCDQFAVMMLDHVQEPRSDPQEMLQQQMVSEQHRMSVKLSMSF